MVIMSLIQSTFIDLQLSTQRVESCLGIQKYFLDPDDFKIGWSDSVFMT